MKARTIVVLSVLVSAAVAVLATVWPMRVASGYTPPLPGVQIPNFASSTVLSEQGVVGLTSGAVAWVTNQGAWTYTTGACPATCDGTNACGSAPCAGLCVHTPSSTCWLRGATGYPGSGGVTDWYVRTGSTGLPPGSDSNDCQSPSTPCLTYEEPMRRARGQTPPSFFFTTTIHLLDDVNGNHIVQWPDGWVADTVGVRNHGPVDGGAPYWRGTITAYQSWDAGAQEEGVVTVSPVDGGAAFNAQTFASGLGYFLEVEDGGAVPGCAVTVGEEADGGSVFYTSGCLQAPGSYNVTEPSVGDPVAVYRPTGLAADASSVLYVVGSGGVFTDLVLGNPTSGAGSVNVGTAGVFNSVEFDSCVLYGTVAYGASYAFGYGSVFAGGLRDFGVYIDTGGLIDQVLPRENGWFDSYGPTLVGMWNGSSPISMPGNDYQSIYLGSSADGVGLLTVSGPFAVVGYFGEPGLLLQQQSSAYVAGEGALWFRNSIGNEPAIDVGGGSKVNYAVAPSVVGTAPSPRFVVHGVGYGALPVSDPDAGAWITQE